MFGASFWAEVGDLLPGYTVRVRRIGPWLQLDAGSYHVQAATQDSLVIALREEIAQRRSRARWHDGRQRTRTRAA